MSNVDELVEEAEIVKRRLTRHAAGERSSTPELKRDARDAIELITELLKQLED